MPHTYLRPGRNDGPPNPAFATIFLSRGGELMAEDPEGTVTANLLAINQGAEEVKARPWEAVDDELRAIAARLMREPDATPAAPGSPDP